MKEFYQRIKNVKLFTELDESNYDDVLACLHAKVSKYKKGQILQLPGDRIKSIGIVIEGRIEISRIDYAGNRFIVNTVEYPNIFGEAFIFAGMTQSPVTLTALEDSIVMTVDFESFRNDSDFMCLHFRKVVINLLEIIAKKNLFLSSRLELVTQKTIRAKLAAYLSNEIQMAHKTQIKIPYNRNQLADYLSVNRSAMSNELCKMRQQGILDFHKNSFEIHKPELLFEIIQQ